MSEVTQILESMRLGKPLSSDQLLPLVYGELRQLAARKMASESPHHTLQATALVHEAWLRLSGGTNHSWENRAHFFGAAAEAMRRILIDIARRKMQVRHGSGQKPLCLEDLEIPAPGEDREILLLINDVLDQLATADPAKAEIVKLRFFAGFSNREIAELMNLSERTVERAWVYSKAWLFEAIKQNNSQNRGTSA